LPFVYIRSEKKVHGLENQIEGVAESGQSVVVVEDLISTGGSSLKAVEALRAAGCNVKGMVAIFTYGLSDAEENFKAANCTLHTLTNYDYLIKKALEQNHIKDSDLQSLIKWRENPKGWGQDK
jgi:orotate phosphoribosyltransferase